jgi:hypothetical protein
MSARRQYRGLDDEIGDEVPMGRDSACMLVSEKLQAASEARDRELDEKIRMGWGNTETRNIPGDWRERRGPDTPERRARLRQQGRGGRSFAAANAARTARLAAREHIAPEVFEDWKRRRRAMKQAQTGT